MEILLHGAEFVPGASVPLFELRPPVFDGFDYVVKRSFDFLGALLLLLVLSPLLLVMAAAVAITSRGGVFYRSIRPGIGGEPFASIKFRTMRSDADQMQADLESLNEASGALFKIRRDPRLTRVGRLLRRFSLDELPQLFNVVRGQMSLVGPRPLPQRDFDQLEDWHKKRYLVLPGMTGLWQVSGRSELDFDDLVRLDFLYLERWSSGWTSRSCSRRSRPSSAGAAPSDPPRPARRVDLERRGPAPGEQDPALSETGRAQARALAPLVARFGIPASRAVVSDLTRARETAELLGVGGARQDPAWREIDVARGRAGRRQRSMPRGTG